MYVMFQNFLVLMANSLYKMHLRGIMMVVVFDEDKYRYSLLERLVEEVGQFVWEVKSSLFLTCTGLLVIYCSNTGCSCYLLICLYYSCSCLGTSSLEKKQCWILISGNPLCLWLFVVHIYPNFSKLKMFVC